MMSGAARALLGVVRCGELPAKSRLRSVLAAMDQAEAVAFLTGSPCPPWLATIPADLSVDELFKHEHELESVVLRELDRYLERQI
jgi:hypothetical protein